MDFYNLPHLVYQNSDQFCLDLRFRDCSSDRTSNLLLASPYSQSNAISVEIPTVFTQIITTTLLIWLTTGHGEYQVLSERVKHNKLRVNLKAGSSYIHYVELDKLKELEQWCEQVLTVIRSQRQSE
jgi:hypothetical protein